MKDCHYCDWACCKNAEGKFKCCAKIMLDECWFDTEVTGNSTDAEHCKWYEYNATFPKANENGEVE